MGPEAEMMAYFGSAPTPLLPVTHTHSSSQPVIYLWNRAIVLPYSEVVHPATNVLSELTHPVTHGYEPTSTGQLLYPPFKFPESLFRPSDGVPLESETQEVDLVCRCHPAFALVDLEPELSFQKVLNTGLWFEWGRATARI